MLVALAVVAAARGETHDFARLANALIDLEALTRVAMARINGAGVIDEFHLKLDPCDAPLLRSTLLKMHWDDEPRDSVDAPVGDFFANSYNLTPFKSLPMGLTADGWYSNFPMPFGKRASIGLVNESANRTVTARVKLVFHRTEGLPDNVGLFHAKWRREQTTAVDLFAAAIPYEPNNDILARPRAVFLMWLLNEAVRLGLPAEERDRIRREFSEFKGTENERRRQVDRVLVELAGKLGLKRE